jgi:hypothetical protein
MAVVVMALIQTDFYRPTNDRLHFFHFDLFHRANRARALRLSRALRLLRRSRIDDLPLDGVLVARIVHKRSWNWLGIFDFPQWYGYLAHTATPKNGRQL